MTDPIADMLTRIRNAVQSRHTRVDVPASKLKLEIARILEAEGYIGGFKLIDNPTTPASPQKVVRLALKYGPRGERVISGLERVSRPGRRVYFGRESVPTVLGGLGQIGEPLPEVDRPELARQRRGAVEDRGRSGGHRAFLEQPKPLSYSPVAVPALRHGRHRESLQSRGSAGGGRSARKAALCAEKATYPGRKGDMSAVEKATLARKR